MTPLDYLAKGRCYSTLGTLIGKRVHWHRYDWPTRGYKKFRAPHRNSERLNI